MPVIRLEDDEMQKRRRVLAKTHLVKRLRLSWHDWSIKRSKIERRTTARESTIALLRKTRAKREQMDQNPTAVDPITRERISKDSEAFIFKRGNSIARIDAGALIDYILSTGDYCDPESRLPFDDCALRRLDQIGYRLGKPSVLRARADLQAKFQEREFLRDAMCGLERICGDSVTQMFELVEKVNEREISLDDAHVHLLTYIVPEFQSNFSQLMEADKTYARHSAEQFGAFLRGPPNKPIRQTPVHSLVMDLFSTSVEEAFE